MPNRITGNISVQSTFKQLERLFSRRIHVGTSVRTDQESGKTTRVQTSLNMFVPKPKELGHQAGIFISLSNSRGQCFTRIDPIDLDKIIDFLTSHRDEALQAFEEASRLRAQRVAIEKQYLRSLTGEDLPSDDLTTTSDKLIKEIEDREIELQALANLAKLKPFEE